MYGAQTAALRLCEVQPQYNKNIYYVQGLNAFMQRIFVLTIWL